MTTPSQPPAFSSPEPVELPSLTPVSPARPPSHRSTGRPSASSLALALAGVVAVAGLAFAGGRLTAPALQAAAAGTGGFGAGGNGAGGTGGNGAFGNGTGGFGNGGNGGTQGGTSGFRQGAFGGRGGAAISATVTAVAADHLTIRIGGDTGPTIDVKVDPATTYHTQQPGTASDVTAGSKVLVQFDPSASPATGSLAPAAPGASSQPGIGSGPLDGSGGAFASRTAKDVTVLAP